MASMVERKCACCKTAISVRAADVARGWGKFCSKSCKAKVQEKRTGQHATYLRRSEKYDHYLEQDKYLDSVHPFSSEALGQWE